jgi:hypothetical protein
VQEYTIRQQKSLKPNIIYSNKKKILMNAGKKMKKPLRAAVYFSKRENTLLKCG